MSRPHALRQGPALVPEIRSQDDERADDADNLATPAAFPLERPPSARTFGSTLLWNFMRIRSVISLFALWAASAVAAEHWAYVPLKSELPQAPAGTHPIDAFLAAARKDLHLKASPLAEPRLWLERAAYTLTGLPPSPEQLQRISGKADAATWNALLDELLASPAYGERWARHWMDVARYADTSGYNFDQDNRYPFAYTYRDWLVKAFNRDLPFDQFIKLQIAADRIVDKPDHPDLAALGFLTVGPRAGGVETIDDRVDVVTRGFLASTVACARCHDHKTDPITSKDYYSLYSIFENTHEPTAKPVIGLPADQAAYQAYQAEAAKLEQADQVVRQGFVDHIRAKDSVATYLDLAWRAKQENWDHGKATSEAFKRGRFRAKAVLKWRDFLATPNPRFAAWSAEMAAADDAGKKAASERLAVDLLAPSPELSAVVADSKCPLNYGVDRISEFFDREDDNQNRERASAMSRLQVDHAGSPARAMSLEDRKDWSQAVIFKRGNPANRGETFERQWLGFLGGGEFPKDRSPRLSLAEKIADRSNPLTARVIVNRVWAWNFGAPLAEPGDFGPQQTEPPLRPLLDWLAQWFVDHGSSIKALNRLLLTSQAFRLSAEGPGENLALDEGNTRFWKWSRRRLDFESMRDRLLASSGALNTTLQGGRAVKLDEASSDRRRSVYSFIDRYALPGLFVSFDLPHPDHHSAARLQTTVPQQALFFLNSPLVIRQAGALAASQEFKALPDDGKRLDWIYQRLFRREPSAAEKQSILKWLSSADPADYQPKLSGQWQVRHAPDSEGLSMDVREFPLFADKVWKTGPDVKTAPIPWLHVGAGGGHVGSHHRMIFRWVALGAGEVRIKAHLKRTQKDGVPLAWRIEGKGRDLLAEGKFPAESTIDAACEWVPVKPGDTMDFVLRAPEGDTCGGLQWSIQVLGRESASTKPEIVGDFTKEFPKSDSPAPTPASGDPWTDVIQMLWASNDFNFID
jgi:hypothetical protein